MDGLYLITIRAPDGKTASIAVRDPRNLKHPDVWEHYLAELLTVLPKNDGN